MENKSFTYSYSAAKKKEVENIRNKYIPKEESKLEILRRLDKKVQTAGILEALCFGVIGALVFGIGMCFGLDALQGADWLTLVFCIFGALLMLPSYPIYSFISRRTKSRLAPEILRLSEEIINQ